MTQVHILHTRGAARAVTETMSQTAKGYVIRRKKSQVVILGLGQEDRKGNEVNDVEGKAKEVATMLDPNGNAQISYPVTVNEPSLAIKYDFFNEGPVDEKFVEEVAFVAGELFNQKWVLIQFPSGETGELHLIW